MLLGLKSYNPHWCFTGRGAGSLQIISKTGPGAFIALCDQNPKPTRQTRMLFIWGGERRQRKQVNIRLFITATSGSGSIPGTEIQTTLQKLSFWTWTEAVWQSWTQTTTVPLSKMQAPSAWSYMNLAQCFPTWGAAQDNLLGCWKKTFFCIVDKVKKLNSLNFVFISSWFKLWFCVCFIMYIVY